MKFCLFSSIATVISALFVAVPVNATTLSLGFSISGAFSPGQTDSALPPVDVASPGTLQGAFFFDESALNDDEVIASEIIDWTLSWDGGATAAVSDFMQSQSAGDFLLSFGYEVNTDELNFFTLDASAIISTTVSDSPTVSFAEIFNVSTDVFDLSSNQDIFNAGFTDPALTSSAVVTTVPEPSSVLGSLLLLAGMVTFGQRRFKTR